MTTAYEDGEGWIRCQRCHTTNYGNKVWICIRCGRQYCDNCYTNIEKEMMMCNHPDCWEEGDEE